MVSNFDVVIGGGGVIGLTLALLLERQSGGVLRIGLVDMSFSSRKSGPRTSSVAKGPKNMLESIGAWPAEATLASPMRRIDVFDAQVSEEALTPGLTFQCVHDEDPMAWIIRHSDLEGHLLKIAGNANISFIEGKVVSYKPEGSIATIKLQNGDTLQTRLIVAADGVKSRLREIAKAPCVEWSYGKSALVATFSHQEPHADKAIQIFYPEGPFATLPLIGDRSSLVWTLSGERADRLRHGETAELTKEIQRASANHLGPITLEGSVASFPLGYKHVRTFYCDRLAFVGDAVRRVHPLAGQGLNLGLRDIAVLAECIIGTARLGLDFGSREILADYGRRRNLDSIVSSSAFDVLHKIFSLEAVSLRIARQLGTSIFQNNIQIKALLTKEATGLAGSYPEIFDAVNASRLSA